MELCDGCPDYQRRVELYSNRDTGCGLEFYVEPEVVEPEESESEEEEEPEDPEEVEEPVEPTPGGEDDSSNSLVASSVLAVLSAILLNSY